MILLDTNICAYFVSRRFPSVTQRFQQSDPQDLCISSIVAAELAYGVANSTRIESNRLALKDFLSLVHVIPWDERAIWLYAEQKTKLWRSGTKIGELDLLLGCQALALDAVFVTNNTREFERVEGLKLENWAA